MVFHVVFIRVFFSLRHLRPCFGGVRPRSFIQECPTCHKQMLLHSLQYHLTRQDVREMISGTLRYTNIAELENMDPLKMYFLLKKS